MHSKTLANLSDEVRLLKRTFGLSVFTGFDIFSMNNILGFALNICEFCFRSFFR